MSSENQKNVKYIFIAGIWIFIVLLFAGAYRLIWKPVAASKLIEETDSSTIYNNEIRIRADSFSGYSILRSKEVRSDLRAASIKLTIEDDNADCKGRIKALADGTADMAVFTLDSFIKSSIEYGDWPATIIMVIDESRGADAVISKNPTIKSIEDLNSKETRFVLAPDTPSEYLSRVVLASFRLPEISENWIEPVSGQEDVYNAFSKSGSKDRKVYVLWEPYVSKAISQKGTVVIDSSKLRGQIVDVLVARREFIRDNGAVARNLIETYLRATYKISRNEKDMIALLQEDAKLFGSGGISDAQALAMVGGIQWKNTLENYAHFGLLPVRDSRGLPNLQDMIYNITSVLVKTGAIPDNTIAGKENTLYYDALMKEIRDSGFHPAPQLVDGMDVENEKVRGSDDLPSLTDEQWAAIMPVGQMQVRQISFGRGKAEILMQGQRDLEELAKVLQNFPIYYIRITGNARSEGDVAENEKLAQERANSVFEYLKKVGIDKKRMRVQIAPLSDKGGDAQSVSFFLGQLPY